MTLPDRQFERLLEVLRLGEPHADADLLAAYVPWLKLLARLEIGRRFRRKFDESDVVQQTLLEAWRVGPQFRGQTERELLAWLRQILAHVLSHELRRYTATGKRDVRREVSLEQSLGESSQQLAAIVSQTITSPSEQAANRELGVLLADVLQRLPEDYREVIILRNLQGLSHEDVAQRMNRSVGAVRMLWVRALARLKEELFAAAGPDVF